MKKQDEGTKPNDEVREAFERTENQEEIQVYNLDVVSNGTYSDVATQDMFNSFRQVYKSATARHEEEIEKLSSLLNEAEKGFEDTIKSLKSAISEMNHFQGVYGWTQILNEHIETLQKIKESR